MLARFSGKNLPIFLAEKFLGHNLGQILHGGEVGRGLLLNILSSVNPVFAYSTKTKYSDNRKFYTFYLIHSFSLPY